MRKLYFVRADYLGFAEFAGHWMAESPKEAIAIGQQEMKSSVIGKRECKSVTDYSWSARKSKAKPEDMALNLKG